MVSHATGFYPYYLVNVDDTFLSENLDCFANLMTFKVSL